MDRLRSYLVADKTTVSTRVCTGQTLSSSRNQQLSYSLNVSYQKAKVLVAHSNIKETDSVCMAFWPPLVAAQKRV